jgi:hypothetical protein
MFIEAVGTAAAEVAFKKALERRSRVRAFAKELNEIRKHGNINIVLLGEAGVGKTTTQRLLTGKWEVDTVPAAYRPTIGVDKDPLRGRAFALVLAGAGQSALREASAKEIFPRIQNGKRVVVIHVVTYGFNDLSLVEFNSACQAVGAAGRDDFLEKFLAFERQKELETLRELLKLVRPATGTVNLVTLVTKQDLWWDRRNDVRHFYSANDSRYKSEVDAITHVRGAANFSHHIVSCALIPQNLRTQDDVLVAPVVTGYDKVLLLANYDRAFQQMGEVLRSMGTER